MCDPDKGVSCFDFDSMGALKDCYGCVDKKHMIVRPNPLPDIMKIYFCAEVTTVYVRIDGKIIPPELRQGDIIVVGKWPGVRSHALFVQKTDRLSFQGTLVDSHSDDYCGHTLESVYRDKGYVYYEFIHFPYNDPGKRCTCFAKNLSGQCVTKPKATGCKKCDPETGIIYTKCLDSPMGGANICASLNTCVTYESCSSLRSCEEVGMCITAPGGDCPDDTNTVGAGLGEKASNPSIASIKSSPIEVNSIAILNNGYSYDMQAMLKAEGVSVNLINPSDISPYMEYKVIIIPTAGLFGLDNSQLFKATLAEYVSSGGKVLCLTRQFGHEFSVLPGGLSGYGWQEDQSCFSGSSYMVQYHPIMAGLASAIPSLNVDGYFTVIPQSSTVLYRRTSNGQPNLIYYPFGQGYVIVGTLFSDWAYHTQQASKDDIKLIRDIVSFMRCGQELPAISPGGTISLNLTVENPSNNRINATRAIVKIYDPDFNLKETIENPIN